MADIFVIFGPTNAFRGDRAAVACNDGKTGARMQVWKGCVGSRDSQRWFRTQADPHQVCNGLAERLAGRHRMGTRHGVEVVWKGDGEAVHGCIIVQWCSGVKEAIPRMANGEWPISPAFLRPFVVGKWLSGIVAGRELNRQPRVRREATLERRWL